MGKNLKWKALLVVFVVASMFWLMYPPSERINLGLDLQGGTHLVLKVDTSKIPKESRSDAIRLNLEILRNRIDRYGISEPSIQPQGTDRIIVNFPGVEDSERLIKLIGQTAILEFKLVAPWYLAEGALNKIDKITPILDKLEIKDTYTQENVSYKVITFDQKNANQISAILNSEKVIEKIPSGYEFLMSELPKGEGQQKRELYLLKEKAEISGQSLTNVYWQKDQESLYENYVIHLKFDYKGAGKLRQLTKQAAKKYNDDQIVSRLAIVLDNVVNSAPTMTVEVDSSPIIKGRFTKDEASDLILVLNEGALAAPMIKEQQTTIGPALGQDSIKKGVRAAILGSIIVLVFMGVYYLFAGLLANLALCLNIIIILGALSYFKATLTLPGIAGIILTIGMAVDANVLIFERIREELKAGKSIRPAIQAGYHKVFSTILDANLTTMITAFILYKIGTGAIKGFGFTLMVGIMASMFTALVVTRLIFDFLTIKINILKKLPMLQILDKPNFNFIDKRRVAYLVSAIVILIGLIAFGIRGGNNFGIDFTGGAIQQIRFQKTPDIDKVREALREIGLEKASIQYFGKENEVLIRTETGKATEIKNILKDTFKDNKATILRVEEVGPTVGRELRQKAIWAILLAMVAISVYITFRFEFKFAICALIALLHDVLVTLGIFSIMQREISLPIIAAILTIIGYSLNDTIVVFDRIREDLKLMDKAAFKDIVNTSINQTLSRTIITSLTTLIVVLALYFFGGSVINDFALVLLIGVIVGTYSSVFVAAPILVEWHREGK